ncbi:hypothetical protein Tco_1233525 [Tanacetum coccineum]
MSIEEIMSEKRLIDDEIKDIKNDLSYKRFREMCGTKVCEEQKQNMEDTMLDLLEICRQKELYCIHNNVDDLMESALNSKLLSINLNSQSLNKEEQEVKNIAEPAAKQALENIENKDSYVSNLDEPALLVTPLSDANENECFDPGGDEIDAFLDLDISTEIENNFHESEGDIIFLEKLLINNTFPNLPSEDSLRS